MSLSKQIDAPDSALLALRATVATIVGKYGHNYFHERSMSGDPMHEPWEELGHAGFLGLRIAEDFGCGGTGLLQLDIVLEKMAVAGRPELAMVLLQGMAGNVLSLHGSDEQKKQYLPGIASGFDVPNQVSVSGQRAIRRRTS